MPTETKCIILTVKLLSFFVRGGSNLTNQLEEHEQDPERWSQKNLKTHTDTLNTEEKEKYKYLVLLGNTCTVLFARSSIQKPITNIIAALTRVPLYTLHEHDQTS